MASMAGPDRPAGKGVLAAACVSAFIVNANTSAVTILLPSISEDVGAPVAELQVASLFNATINNHLDDGASDADALAAGMSSACVLMAIWAALGIALIVVMRRQRVRHTRAVDRAAGAAAAFHTIPIPHERDELAPVR